MIFCFTERRLSAIILIPKTLYAPVAQLDRASDSDSEGHAFKSHRAYQSPAFCIAKGGTSYR